MENIEKWIPYIISIAIIIIVSIIIARILIGIINAMIKREERQENPNVTQLNFLKNSVRVVIYSVATIMIINTIPTLKSLGTALFAGAGILAAIIGFASQQAFANVIGGIFIILFKPFRVGDTIEIGGSVGRVLDITLRHVVIRDLENRRIIIPNSRVSEEKIINSTIDDERILKHITFGTSYESNIDKAMEIIQEEIRQHPYYLDNRTEAEREANEPSIRVKVIALSDSSVDLRAFAWAQTNPKSLEMEWDVLKSVKERFDREGIDIPYPHRTIVQK